MAGQSQRIQIRDDLVKDLKQINGAGKYHSVVKKVITEEPRKMIEKHEMPILFIEMGQGEIDDRGGSHPLHVQPFIIHGGMYVGNKRDPDDERDRLIKDVVRAVMDNANRSKTAVTTHITGPPITDLESGDKRRAFELPIEVRYLMPRNLI